MDLQSAYNQVQMEPGDQRKTAFTTPFGLYEYTRMQFGLCNAPATFQRLMQTAFHADMFNILLVYLVDIVVYSNALDEHLARLDTVFTRLGSYGLKLEVKKCSFFQKSGKYLGHVVSGEGVATDPEKVTAVREWAVLETLRNLRSFIGFASYFRRYVPRFTQLATLLHRMVTSACKVRKGKRRTNASSSIIDVWTEDYQQSFDALKLALTSAPVLEFVDYRLPFIVETGASDRGLGAVLSQKQDGRHRIIAYASRGLRSAERNDTNYSSMKLETLALMWAITDKFRDYLIGGLFTVYTDNNTLSYFHKKAKLSAVEQRWAAALASFNFDIKYRPGHCNANADGLSRLPHVTRGSAYVLILSCLRDKVLQEWHDHAGHQGAERTEHLIRGRCFWPTTHADVLGWTKKCDRCALAKIQPHKLRTPLGRLMATQPLEVVAMEFTMFGTIV